MPSDAPDATALTPVAETPVAPASGAGDAPVSDAAAEGGDTTEGVAPGGEASTESAATEGEKGVRLSDTGEPLLPAGADLEEMLG